ncbi:MAG: glycosyltransferase, partial [Actinobacteria bacterium]|nr:glycosyltransferase [Actinomycetota bacterium]
MRIAYLVPSLGLQEGQGTANLEILRRIARAGHTVDVFTSSAPSIVRALNGVRIRKVPRLPAWQLGNQLISLGSTSAMLRDHYDVVHADA